VDEDALTPSSVNQQHPINKRMLFFEGKFGGRGGGMSRTRSCYIIKKGRERVFERRQ